MIFSSQKSRNQKLLKTNSYFCGYEILKFFPNFAL